MHIQPSIIRPKLILSQDTLQTKQTCDHHPQIAKIKLIPPESKIMWGKGVDMFCVFN